MNPIDKAISRVEIAQRIIDYSLKRLKDEGRAHEVGPLLDKFLEANTPEQTGEAADRWFGLR